MGRSLVTATILVFVLFSVTSCSEASSGKKGIIGKWFASDGNESIEFVSDGTVIIVESGRSRAGNFKFLQDGRLKMDFGIGATVLEVSIDKEGALSLKEPSGKVGKYLNQKAYKAHLETQKKIEQAKRTAEAEQQRAQAEQRRAAEERIRLEKAEHERRLRAYFTDNGNGTVTINDAKLMWTKSANLPQQVLTWNEAMEYVERMNKGMSQNYGHSDWRLPGIEELKGLVKSLDNPNAPFSNVYCCGCFWSATISDSDARNVWFFNKLQNSASPWAKTYKGCFVWPVRNGQ